MRTISVCLFVAGLLLGATGCATVDEPQGPQMQVQNECVQIADRTERQRCLDEAAFGKGNY